MSDYIDTGADGPSYVLPPIESGPPAETSKLQSRTPNWNLMSAFPESGRSNLLKWPDFKVRFRPRAVTRHGSNAGSGYQVGAGFQFQI